VDYSEIGLWSEAKLDIIAKYARAYSRILTKQKIFTHVYVDAFAGPGLHRAKLTGQPRKTGRCRSTAPWDRPHSRPSATRGRQVVRCTYLSPFPFTAGTLLFVVGGLHLLWVGALVGADVITLVVYGGVWKEAGGQR
jgi:hypothetical protein